MLYLCETLNGVSKTFLIVIFDHSDVEENAFKGDHITQEGLAVASTARYVVV